MKKVIILNGYPKSGKTAFELILARLTLVLIRSSVDCVKEIAMKYFEWNGIKDEETRKFLSNLKRMFSEEFDYIFQDLHKTYAKFMESDAELLLIDSREPDEIRRLQQEFNAITVFVQRKNCQKIMSNPSDANVENFKYDYYIDNNGTLEDLEQKAVELLSKLKSIGE